MKSHARSTVALTAMLGMALTPLTALAINKNGSATGPNDWTSANWVDDAGNPVASPTTGDQAFLGRAVPGSATPSSFDITTTVTPDHVYVGWQTANGSVLDITSTGNLTTGQLYAGNNGVNGVIQINGTVITNDTRAGNSGAAGSTVNLNSGGSLTTSQLFVGVGGNGTFNHNGGTLNITGTFLPFYSGSGSTINLNGNNISAPNIHFGSGGGGANTLNRGGANLLATSSFQVDNGASVTIEAGDTVGTYFRSYNTSTVTLNTPVTMSSGNFDLSNNATLNLGGNNLTVNSGSFRVNQFGGPDSTLNRGGGSIIASNFDVRNSGTFTYTNSDSFTNDGIIYNGGVFTMAKDLTLSGTLHVSNNSATLAMGGNDLSVGTLSIGHFGSGGAFVTRSAGSSITANTVDVRSGEDVNLRAGDQINNTLFIYLSSSSATVTQLTGDTTGLTLGTTLGTGTLTFGDASNVLNLIFDAVNGAGDWVFRWANPGSGDRIATINSLIGGGDIVVSGASYNVLDGGDGFTYIQAVPSVIPEPASLALLAMGAMRLGGRRRSVA